MAEVKWTARRISDGVLVDVTGDTESTPAVAPTANALEGGGGGAVYVQATDPGAVGAGGIWKDISLGSGTNAKWWERNVTNDGWDAMVLLRVVAGGANNAVASLRSVASGSGAAQVDSSAQTAGAGLAISVSEALALGTGSAIIGGVARADGNGTANADVTAQTLGTGQATASLGATASGNGAASNFLAATADGSGPASGGVSVQTATGLAYMAVIAYRGAEQAGMTAEIDGTSARLAFNDATPIAKPNITGSRGGNAALASLITQLVNLGLITDGTS